METLILRNLKAKDLPFDWAKRLPSGKTFTVTIIEEETERHTESSEPVLESDEPLFGIWSDYSAVNNVDLYVRRSRRGRFNAD